MQPVSNNLDPDEAQHCILSDLGPNCLKSRLRWYMFTSIVPEMGETEEDLNIGKNMRKCKEHFKAIYML